MHSILVRQNEENRPPVGSDRTNETNTNTNTNTSREISACLILEFPSCCLRIFSSTSSNNPIPDDDTTVIGNVNYSQETADDITTKFDAVRNKLESILSQDCHLLPFPLSYSGLTAPSGQKLVPDVVYARPGEHNNGDALCCARQCLQSYSQSWKDLILFDDTLKNPIRFKEYSVPPSVGSIRENNFKEAINQLMVKIPKQISSSFIEQDQWTAALESYDKKLSTKMKAFDDVIDDFWGDTQENCSNNKRRRDEEDRDYDSDECQRMIQHDCAGRFVEILKDHKKHLISKHELYLLPLRG